MNGTVPERKRLSLLMCDLSNWGRLSSVRAVNTEVPPPEPPASRLAWHIWQPSAISDIWNQNPSASLNLLDFFFYYFMVVCGFMMEN